MLAIRQRTATNGRRFVEVPAIFTIFRDIQVDRFASGDTPVIHHM